jgi:hypothetical protein
MYHFFLDGAYNFAIDRRPDHVLPEVIEAQELTSRTVAPHPFRMPPTGHRTGATPNEASPRTAEVVVGLVG